jgi:hypothetical protein
MNGGGDGHAEISKAEGILLIEALKIIIEEAREGSAYAADAVRRIAKQVDEDCRTLGIDPPDISSSREATL